MGRFYLEQVLVLSAVTCESKKRTRGQISDPQLNLCIFLLPLKSNPKTNLNQEKERVLLLFFYKRVARFVTLVSSDS